VSHEISGELAVGASASTVPSRCVEVSAELAITASIGSARIPHAPADRRDPLPFFAAEPRWSPSASGALLAADLSRTRRAALHHALTSPGAGSASAGASRCLGGDA